MAGVVVIQINKQTKGYLLVTCWPAMETGPCPEVSLKVTGGISSNAWKLT